MNQPPRAGARPADDAVAVVSAYGAFRVQLVHLAAWSFFAGFSLLTQGLGQLSFGGQDDAAERVVGAQMILLAPVYGLIAWRRSEYRLLIWIPYAAQLAIVLPGLWELLTDGETDGALLLIVSIIFLILLIYVWSSSHPLGFFQPEEAEDEDEDTDAEEYDDADPGIPADDAAARARRYRRSD
jgi:hypothetical protein